MDFKVAGTRQGITALQMDIKISGITPAILEEALAQAKVARFEILDVIESAIAEPRPELAPTAPKIDSIQIPVDKIKVVIGKGGEMLKKISSMARADCEKFMGTKVFLTTWVKVKENWRDSDFLVKNFGYKD